MFIGCNFKSMRYQRKLQTGSVSKWCHRPFGQKTALQYPSQSLEDCGTLSEYFEVFDQQKFAYKCKIHIYPLSLPNLPVYLMITFVYIN